jgi:hypothetical protein
MVAGLNDYNQMITRFKQRDIGRSRPCNWLAQRADPCVGAA